MAKKSKENWRKHWFFRPEFSWSFVVVAELVELLWIWSFGQAPTAMLLCWLWHHFFRFLF